MLGLLVVQRDGREIQIGAAKQRAILTLLLLRRGELVPTETLVEELWKGHPPASAVKAVQVYVSHLRKALGEGVVETRPGGYVLRVEDADVDADRFEELLARGRTLLSEGNAHDACVTLQEALALWRGPPLPEFRFDDFARDETGRLEKLRLVAQEDRIQADLALGRQAQVVPELETLIRDHPLRERLRELLMLALYRAGRQADALAAYQDARSALLDEFGLDPSLPLQELERAILRHDPALDAPVPQVILASEESALHRGTVTFLFTSIEDVTGLLKRLGPSYSELLDAYGRILEEAAANHDGREVDNQADSLFFAFARANEAVAAGVAAELAVAEHAWPGGVEVRVRMGIHTGEPSVGRGRYHGLDVHRAAQIGAVARGGQILLSNTTRELADDLPSGVSIRDLGSYQLKGIDHPERLYQLEVEGLPNVFSAPEADRAKTSRRQRRPLLLGAGLAVALIAALLAVTLGYSGSAHSLARLNPDSAGAIDPKNNHLVSAVAVGSGPGKVASGFESVWVVNEYASTISRIDPVSGTSQDTIHVDADPTAIAIDRGSVWVTSSGTRQLDRINPQTQTVVQRTGLGNGPSGIAVSPGALWVTNRLDDTVTEIDAATGKSRRTFVSGTGPSDIAYGLGALWITNEPDATVTRLDPRTGALEEVAVGNGPVAVAVGDGSVWVANSLDGTVARVNPTQDVVSAEITVGTGPSSVLVSDGSVWVADSYSGRVDRIDTATDTIVATVAVGSGPQSLASLDGRIWLTARQGPTSHRGGTLRLYDLVKPDSFDQGLAYASQAWEELANTSDGLVGFERVGGLEGGTVVQDLATSLPRPTDGGRTYTFHLRRGLHYSTGTPVLPSDFRRGLERAFRIGNPYASYYYDGIVGASACNKARCDLSHGIVGNDRTGTVTIHLRARDPELFYKLALPAAWPVPSGTPITMPMPLGVPGTGPVQARELGPRSARSRSQPALPAVVRRGAARRVPGSNRRGLQGLPRG